MIIVDVLRHGECQGGEIFRGATDVALSELGWRQMRAAVDRHPPGQWQGVISSPLRRCREFAEAQAERLGLPLVVDEDWRELSFGDWEGQQRADLMRADRQAVEAFYRDPVNAAPPNGECGATLDRRVQAAWQRCLSDASGKRLLLVTHGGVIRALLTRLLGMPLDRMFALDVPYACMSGIHHMEGQTENRLLYHNPSALL